MVPDEPPFDLALGELRSRTSAKWRAGGPDVLPLWIAEMDVHVAPPVVEAVRGAFERGDTGYPYGTGYAEAFAAFAAERWGFDGFDAGRSALVPDVMRGAVEVLRLVTDRGDPVVVTPPVYPPFYGFIEDSGRRVVEVPLTDRGRLDLPALADVFASLGAKERAAFLLCNPQNPAGTVHTRGELATVAAAAEASGVRVVADEIHAPLVLSEATFTPYLSVPGADRGFALVSASKGWNVPGLKAAVCFAGHAAAADLARLPEEVAYGPSHLGVLAHCAALRHGGEWLDSVLRGIERNRALLGELLAAHLPGARWSPGAATYLAWIDLGDVLAAAAGAGTENGAGAGLEGRAGVDPAAWFRDHAGVLLSSGAAFGPGGENFVRLNFATSATVLSRALAQMGDAVAAATQPARHH